MPSEAISYELPAASYQSILITFTTYSHDLLSRLTLTTYSHDSRLTLTSHDSRLTHNSQLTSARFIPFHLTTNTFTPSIYPSLTNVNV